MKCTVFIDVALLGSLHSEFKMFNHTTIFFLTNGKFRLSHGLRQLTRDINSDVQCLQTSFTRRYDNDVQNVPSYNVNCKTCFKTTTF